MASCSSNDDGSARDDASTDTIQVDGPAVQTDGPVIYDDAGTDTGMDTGTDASADANEEAGEDASGDALTADAPVADAPVADAPVADAPPADAPVADVPVADVPVADGPVADAPVADALPADALLEDLLLVDGPLPDMTSPDLPLPDAVVVHDAGPACFNSTLVQTYSSDMVICQGSVKASQCDAAQLCGGWSLCTATQFRARGGETTPATTEAWLAGCIRNGGSLGPPTDVVCSSCSGVASFAVTSWECDGSTDTGTSAARVGVASHGTCHRVGINSTSQEAYWIAQPSDIQLQAVVCCK